MFKKENGHLPDARFLLRAVSSWMICACVLVFLAAMAANAFRLGERGLGYLSSAVSFLAAAAAGIFSDRARNTSRFAVCLISATTLVIILLTVGYLVRGEEMNSSAVLSIVSFTYAGVLTGVFLQPTGKGNGRKTHNRKLT